MSRSERLLVVFQSSVLAASLAGAAASSSVDDWHPPGLLVLLGLVTVVSGALPIQVGGFKATASSVGLALIMTLMGPAPAVAVGVTTILGQGLSRRVDWRTHLVNASTFAAFPLAGGLAMEAARTGGVVDGPVSLAIAVGLIFMLANSMNFMAIALDFRVRDGLGIGSAVKEMYVPVIPVELASAVLTATLAAVYDTVGVGIVILIGAVGLVFQYLLHLTFESRRRGEQLETRTQELAALQVGLLSTVLKTLALRDKMTARHSAAVARYSKAVAEEIGLPEREQELIHTAGLLHDIGKFIFPDDILLADSKLTDEQYELVKKHPEQGARLVESIEGYGPVAEIVRAHHERIDGRGYPNGIVGEDIPIGSRIISIADTYDVMTSRDSYRKPVSKQEAIDELRRVAGGQLDAHLVEVFIGLVERQVVGFRHNDAADFERELNLQRKVRAYAEPRQAVAA
jgi:putative nucleotidyltransferase with HDIG domain